MPYGRDETLRRGSIARAAQRMEHLLDREAEELIDGVPRSILIEQAAPFELHDYPRGGKDWAAQQFRLMFQREAHEKLRGRQAESGEPGQTLGLPMRPMRIESAAVRLVAARSRPAAKPTVMSTATVPPPAMIQVLGAGGGSAPRSRRDPSMDRDARPSAGPCTAATRRR